MSKRKGLSHDEKRQRLLELLFEKKEFYQLRELEKIAPKEKGITSMSVKEVLQSLVDDNLVDTEKIGTSVYFWAYPSKAKHMRKCKIDDLEAQITDYEQKIDASSKSLKKASKGRDQSDERDAILKELAEKEALQKEMEQELEKLKECDPEVLESMRKEISIAKEATNRWTDNVFTIKSWCTRKFGVEEKMIDKNFGIPEDFDYVD